MERREFLQFGVTRFGALALVLLESCGPKEKQTQVYSGKVKEFAGKPLIPIQDLNKYIQYFKSTDDPFFNFVSEKTSQYVTDPPIDLEVPQLIAKPIPVVTDTKNVNGIAFRSIEWEPESKVVNLQQSSGESVKVMIPKQIEAAICLGRPEDPQLNADSLLSLRLLTNQLRLTLGFGISKHLVVLLQESGTLTVRDARNNSITAASDRQSAGLAMFYDQVLDKDSQITKIVKVFPTLLLMNQVNRLLSIKKLDDNTLMIDQLLGNASQLLNKDTSFSDYLTEFQSRWLDESTATPSFNLIHSIFSVDVADRINLYDQNLFQGQLNPLI